jgi:hypothetical protein
LKIANRGRAGAKVRIYDAYSRRTGVAFIGEGDEWTRHFPLAGSFGWYDFTLLVDGDASFAQQLAGRRDRRGRRHRPAAGGGPVESPCAASARAGGGSAGRPPREQVLVFAPRRQ